jgi:hypothetical protein
MNLFHHFLNRLELLFSFEGENHLRESTILDLR